MAEMRRTVTIAGACIATGIASMSYGEHTVGGKGVHDVFPEAKVARLAAVACEADIDAMKQAIADGADVNASGLEGSTPLMWAVSCESEKGIAALLEAGAKPNQPVARFNAVYVAATYRNPALLRLLLQHGGDPNSSDANTGVTALRRAADLGTSEDQWANYYALLNAQGVDINRADKHGQTIATDFCKGVNFDKLLEVLDRGYDYDLQELGNLLQVVSRRVLSAEQMSYRTRVRSKLISKGVKLPPEPEPTIR